jgi:hypothetical protein
LGFVAFALAISSIHAGISVANLSIFVFLACGYALFLSWRRYEIAAGVLLTLGFCVKPTGAIAAFVIVLVYERWVTCVTCVGLSAAVAAGSAIAMSHVDTVWKVDYVKNIAFLFGPGGDANFTSGGGNFDLVNLQLPIYVLSGSTNIANVVTAVVAVSLVAVWLILFLRSRAVARQWNWLGASSLLLIALLPLYQRNYNAGVIVFAAMWAFRSLDFRDSWTKLASLAGLVFLVPGEAILRHLNFALRFQSNALWNFAVMSQLTWAIVLAILCCFGVSLRQNVSSRAQTG